jgi:hypothetical protein
MHIPVYLFLKKNLRAIISFYPMQTNHSPVLSFMCDKFMPMTEAVEGYDIFDKMQVQKVIFEADK